MATSQRAEIRKRLNRALREIEAADAEFKVFSDGEVPELVGIHEAAEILGIAPATVGSRRHRGKMPAALVELRCGPVWRREDIEALA